MDPISASIGAIGLATSIYGMVKGSKDASQASDVQNQILATEQQENDVRNKAVHVQYQRQQIQNVRNVQRTQAMNKVAATNQGAKDGSGLAGGQAGAVAAGDWNALGASNSLQSSDQMFALDKTIGTLKQDLGNIDSSMATDKGIQGLGSSIMGSASSIGRLFGGGSNPSGGNTTDVTGGIFKFPL